MREMTIKFVIITDGVNYFVHGTNDETPEKAFAAMQGMWTFNPEKETAHFMTTTVIVPEFETPASIVEDAFAQHFAKDND